jgi:hypothetical protein
MRLSHRLHRCRGGHGNNGTGKGRRAFTMVECVVAILVINLTIAGMFKLLKLQERQVAEAEGWLRKDPVYYLNPDPDPMARALGKPASLDAAPVARTWREEALPYDVRITGYKFDLQPLVLQVEFEQTDAKPEEEVEKKKPESVEKPKKKKRVRVEGDDDILKPGQSRLRRNPKESKRGQRR